MTIFVSIAAYRDPELAPTIRDCLNRARYPDNLRFGICWQHAVDEPVPPDFADRRTRVIDVPWQESRGACWARAEIMKLWEGEDFYLQLDSHHRFVQDWDALLLTHAERSEVAKPLLTTYTAPFDPDAAELVPGEPMQMDFDHFSNDGIPAFRPRVIPDWPTLRRPLRARFVAGGFVFTLGSFVSDVPYDPELYFHGEEIMLAIRAFTHGYALFHPHEHILWHEYTRSHRAKHWGDHVRAQGIEFEWHERDAVSREKVRQFLLAPHVGPFGCGTVRSFAEYEEYAGLSFLHRAAQDATLRGEEPPNAPAQATWATEVREWHVRIVLDRRTLQPEALAEPQFWYVGFHDIDGEEICRDDAQGDELQRLLLVDAEQIIIERHFASAKQPVRWTVWPFCHSDGWLEKVVGTVDSSLTGACEN
ncbi:MAG TPA: GlcNAc-transferase family protein [Acetobacteraceae bacterium]|nr:GlcNAc-transferase family protein [Acetobacteraceae bacterium]